MTLVTKGTKMVSSKKILNTPLLSLIGGILFLYPINISVGVEVSVSAPLPGINVNGLPKIPNIPEIQGIPGVSIIFGETPENPQELTPISINTSEVTYTDAVPLVLFLQLNKSDSIVNTGNTVKIKVDRDECTYLIGGTSDKVKYYLQEVNFVWNCKRKTAAHTINGTGVPLEIIYVYVNEKYQTTEEARQNRDGMVTEFLRVSVEGSDNPTYKGFEPILESIKEPNNPVPLARTILYEWVNPTKPNVHPCYYQYSGSYIDFDNGKRPYQCADVIVGADPGPQISDRQFQLFCDLKDNDGNPEYDNRLDTSAPNGRPVIKSGPYIILTSENHCVCSGKY